MGSKYSKIRAFILTGIALVATDFRAAPVLAQTAYAGLPKTPSAMATTANDPYAALPKAPAGVRAVEVFLKGTQSEMNAEKTAIVPLTPGTCPELMVSATGTITNGPWLGEHFRITCLQNEICDFHITGRGTSSSVQISEQGMLISDARFDKDTTSLITSRATSEEKRKKGWESFTYMQFIGPNRLTSAVHCHQVIKDNSLHACEPAEPLIPEEYASPIARLIHQINTQNSIIFNPARDEKKYSRKLHKNSQIAGKFSRNEQTSFANAVRAIFAVQANALPPEIKQQSYRYGYDLP